MKKYEFILAAEGNATLTEDGDLVWASDQDDDFLEEFDDVIDPEQVDDVIDWLEDGGYIEEGADVEIVDETGEPLAGDLAPTEIH